MNKTLLNATKYEKFVFNTFKNFLHQDRLLVNSKKSKVVFHPRYYSKDRKAYITFDVAIETRLHKRDKKPSSLTLIECKYYSSKIPVNDVEEFVSKVRQVSGLNVKAVFVTNSTFQPAALTYGVANEIGIARLISGKSIVWLSKRTMPIEKNHISNFVQEYVTTCLLDQAECSNNFIGSFNGIYTTDIYVYLHAFGLIGSYYESVNISNYTFKAKYIPYDKFEEIAEKIINEFWADFTGSDRKEMLINGITNLYKINIIENRHLGMLHDELVLGKIDFNSADLFINKIINRTDPRWIFTLMHEFCHFILHKEELQSIKKELLDNETTLNNSEMSIDNKSFSQFEWQANHLAACLLIPRNELKSTVFKVFKKNDIKKLPLYLDSQSVNIALCENITIEIAEHFHCSKTVVFIRLKELGLLLDHSSRSIKNILSSHINSLGA